MNKLIKIVLVVFIMVIFDFTSYAQSSHFTTNSYWKHQRKEILFGIGASNFLGDLGGLNKVGTGYSPLDMEWLTTRPSGHIGYRYRLSPKFSTKSLLSYMVLKGDDALTSEPTRRNRNLKFRSHLFELSQQFEVIIYNSEAFGARYRPLGVKGNKHKNTLVYAFTGISGFFFIPQGQGDGGWTNLRPLHTEGQGLPNGPDQYSNFGVAIPFGIGTKVSLDELWRVTLELTYTKTFTDYIDDVSTDYYDKSAISAAYGNDAAFFSDPSSGYFPSWTATGEQRGDPGENDAYLMFNVSFTRNITYKRKRGKKWQYRARF